MDSPVPVKPGVTPASLTAQSERPRARTTQASLSQIPGLQKLVIDVYCFKLLTLWVICRTAVDNNMTRHSGHLRGVIVVREMNIILDEHSEVFSTVQECRPE